MVGIIREARRPEGWVAPGPRPRGADGDAALAPADDEDLCLLTGEWRVFQKLRGHRWSMDDLVTAFIAARAVEGRRVARFLDLGCGIGSVLMMVGWRFPEATGVGVEAQPVSAAMAVRSLRYNGAEARIAVRNRDFREDGVFAPSERFDLVTGTPPYFPHGTGVESEKVQCGPCRFEHRGGVEEYCLAAAPRLAEGATFVVCGAAGERDRAFAGAAAAGLGVVEAWVVVPREGVAPLVGVWVMQKRAQGAVREETMTVRDRTGQWTPGFLAVRAAMGMPPAPRVG